MRLQVIADQLIGVRGTGKTVDDPGFNPTLIQVSGNGGQTEGGHDIGYPGDITFGLFKFVPQGMDKENMVFIQGRHG